MTINYQETTSNEKVIATDNGKAIAYSAKEGRNAFALGFDGLWVSEDDNGKRSLRKPRCQDGKAKALDFVKEGANGEDVTEFPLNEAKSYWAQGHSYSAHTLCDGLWVAFDNDKATLRKCRDSYYVNAEAEAWVRGKIAEDSGVRSIHIETVSR